ncbi:TIGR03557 family F420-dependent LLM class oxidoreductase [Actinomadura kijaniata]|uniref:TIGR03557 family F420-dependent LLM class oxidoreductase n=1 Tax=Actinomadura kijaniata TaxID=46161 RepID=UPI003F1B7480
MKIGYKLFAEAYDPKEVVRQAVAAERAGFDFVEVSDHYHPWLEEQGHSGFAWAMLANAAARTERITLMTGVTCPTMRYHPAIVAQAAATLAILSDGRFRLGVGSGERLNEHVIGGGWPAVHVRQEMLREALEIIRLLWSGGYHSYDGQYLEIAEARVFDLPAELPEIVVAAGGPKAAKIAADLGDGIFNTEDDPSVLETYAAEGGKGPRYCEVMMSYAGSEQDAVAAAREKMRFGLTGWKVMAELPNPGGFDAATSTVTEDDIRQNFSCGPDPESHIKSVQNYVNAGFDHLTLANAGPDVDGFFEFFTSELQGPLRELRTA